MARKSWQWRSAGAQLCVGTAQELLPQQFNCLARCCFGGCSWSWCTGSCLWQQLFLAFVIIKWLQQSSLLGNDCGSWGPGIVGILVGVGAETKLVLQLECCRRQLLKKRHRTGQHLNNSVALHCSSNYRHL